jgi:hypothetical protein
VPAVQAGRERTERRYTVVSSKGYEAFAPSDLRGYMGADSRDVPPRKTRPTMKRHPKKLVLKKETVSNLDIHRAKLQAVLGGVELDTFDCDPERKRTYQTTTLP